MDCSGSVPAAFRGEALLDALADTLSRATERFGVVEMGVLQMGDAPYRAGISARDVWTRDPDTLRARGLEAVTGRACQHEVWQMALFGQRQLGATLLVWIGDGDRRPEPTEALDAAVRAGVPIITVAVGRPSAADLARMEDLAGATGGRFLDFRGGVQPDALVEIYEGYLAEVQESSLIVQYTAPTEGPVERTVTLQVGDAVGAGRYTAPEAPAPVSPLTGLRARIRIGDVEVTRLLAGLDHDPLDPGDSGLAELDVLSTLLSPSLLVLEGDAPPASVWLTEIAEATLSQRDLTQGIATGQPDLFFAALNQGQTRALSPRLWLASPPLPGALSAEARTVALGMRASLVRQRVDPATGSQRTSFDLLPTAQFVTLRREPRGEGPNNFELNLQRTAWMAVTEAAAFGALADLPEEEVALASTLTLLGDTPLYYDPPRNRGNLQRLPDDLADWDEAVAAEWLKLMRSYGSDHQLYLPASGTPVTLWAVHRRTGELYGILSDGSGGADRLDRIREQLAAIERAAAVLEALFTVTRVGGPAMGVLVAYFANLARMYGAVAVVIATLDVREFDAQMRAAIAAMACDTLERLAFASLGNTVRFVGKFMTVINGLLALDLDTSLPTPCTFVAP